MYNFIILVLSYFLNVKTSLLVLNNITLLIGPFNFFGNKFCMYSASDVRHCGALSYVPQFSTFNVSNVIHLCIYFIYFGLLHLNLFVRIATDVE